jgi:hypothetical protein
VETDRIQPEEVNKPHVPARRRNVDEIVEVFTAVSDNVVERRWQRK